MQNEERTRLKSEFDSAKCRLSEIETTFWQLSKSDRARLHKSYQDAEVAFCEAENNYLQMFTTAELRVHGLKRIHGGYIAMIGS